MPPLKVAVNERDSPALSSSGMVSAVLVRSVFKNPAEPFVSGSNALRSFAFGGPKRNAVMKVAFSLP